MELAAAPLLKVSNLVYRYPSANYNVLDGLTCEFKAGERVAILGANGVGKSTFFDLISGLVSDYSGNIELGGHEIKNLPRKEIAKQLALVPQKHEPLFPFSVRDFILMGRYARLGVFGAPLPEDLAKIEEAARETGAYRFFNRPYNTLSGGEMQLAIISRALAQEADLLILDEPDTHLDFKNQFIILDLVRKIAQKKNASLLMSLHDPNDVMQFASRVIVLNKGKIIADGKPQEIINPKLLLEIYQIEVKTAKIDENVLFVPASVQQKK